MSPRRVLVTGIGVVAPGAVGTKAFWEHVTSGASATRPITQFDPTPFRSRMAAVSGYSVQQVRDFDDLGLIPPAVRQPNGSRQFTGIHVTALRAYRHLAIAVGPVAARATMREKRHLSSDEAIARIVALHVDLARSKAFTDQQAATPLAERPYDLRHAAVSTWLNGGVAPTKVAEWAGHSVEVLLEVYAKCLDGQDDLAKRQVQAALESS